MRVLVDEQLEGMVPMLRSAGFDIISVKEEYPGEADDKLVLTVKRKGWVFVTEDTRAADVTRFHGVELIQIDLVLKAKAIENALREYEKKGL
jgi:uncharacterized protein with PIN domain